MSQKNGTRQGSGNRHARPVGGGDRGGASLAPRAREASTATPLTRPWQQNRQVKKRFGAQPAGREGTVADAAQHQRVGQAHGHLAQLSPARPARQWRSAWSGGAGTAPGCRAWGQAWGSCVGSRARRQADRGFQQNIAEWSRVIIAFTNTLGGAADMTKYWAIAAMAACRLVPGLTKRPGSADAV